jgi:beta-lactamase superfamily II metal-dependent hydrolase
MRSLGKNWRMALVGLIVVALVGYALCRQRQPSNSGPDIVVGPSDNLTVYFLDVGQGDSVLIDCGSYECLIDAGPEAPVIPSGVVQVPLEAVVVTHAHADHIGGMPDVFKDYVVKSFWYSGESSITQAYSSMMKAVNNEAGCTVHEAHVGDFISTPGADGLIIQVMASGGGADANDSSVVLSVDYGDSAWLFAGDVQVAGEENMIEAGQAHHVNVLKVAHHGSCTGTSEAFLAAVSPEMAVISVGQGNTYGHPCPAVLGRLEAHSVAVFRTDTFGSIVLTTDGSNPVVRVG